MVARRGNAPRSAGCKPAALLLSYRAKKNGSPTWTRTTTIRLTGGHATLTSSGNDTPGRNCTCVVPFRRRMPLICSATGVENGRAPRYRPEYLLVPSEAGCCLPRARLKLFV